MDFIRKQPDQNTSTEISFTQPSFTVPKPNQITTVHKKHTRIDTPVKQKSSWKGLLWGILFGMTIGSLVFYFFLIQPTILSYLVDLHTKGSSSNLVQEEKSISTNSKIVADYFTKLQQEFSQVQTLGCGNIDSAIQSKTLVVSTQTDTAILKLYEDKSTQPYSAEYLTFKSSGLNTLQKNFVQKSGEYKTGMQKKLSGLNDLFPYFALVTKVDKLCSTLSKSILKVTASDIQTTCDQVGVLQQDYAKNTAPTKFETGVLATFKQIGEVCNDETGKYDFQKEFFVFYDDLTSQSYKLNEQKLSVQDNFESYAKTIQSYKDEMNSYFNSKLTFPNQFYFLL
jgi:hypothetical protein